LASRGTLLVVAFGLAVAACGKNGSGDQPTGQVVARLNGVDITQLEVNAELQGAQIPPGMDRRDAEKAALANILTRRKLVEVTEERELTKTPQFQLQQRRTEEQLKVQVLARDIAGKIAQPTRDEALAYIDANPLTFSQRAVYLVDQIQFPRTASMPDLDDADTMESIIKILGDNKIEFRRQAATLDLVGAAPDFAKEIHTILAKNPNEIIVFPNPMPGPVPLMLANQVKESRIVPFTGDKAIEFATRALHNQRIQKALADEVQARRKELEGEVVYQEGWEPDDKTDVDTSVLGEAAAASGTVQTGTTPEPTAPGLPAPVTPAAPVAEPTAG